MLGRYLMTRSSAALKLVQEGSRLTLRLCRLAGAHLPDRREERGVGGLMPRIALREGPNRTDRERQDQPFGLC